MKFNKGDYVKLKSYNWTMNEYIINNKCESFKVIRIYNLLNEIVILDETTGKQLYIKPEHVSLDIQSNRDKKLKDLNII